MALASGYLEQVPRGVRDRKRKETARQVQSPGRMLEHEPAQGDVQRPLSEELGGVGLGGVTQSSSCPRPQGLSPRRAPGLPQALLPRRHPCQKKLPLTSPDHEGQSTGRGGGQVRVWTAGGRLTGVPRSQLPNPNPGASTRDTGDHSSTRLHPALPSGRADLCLGSRGGWPVSSGPLLPQGLSRAPALPTWHLQRPCEAQLRGRATPVPGGGWLWGGPCLYLVPKVEGCHRDWEQSRLVALGGRPCPAPCSADHRPPPSTWLLPSAPSSPARTLMPEARRLVFLLTVLTSGQCGQSRRPARVPSA